MGPPLDGIKVLDFSIAVAAPLGAAMLADMGARVIKVERIQGEPQRLGYNPDDIAEFEREGVIKKGSQKQ